MMSYTMARGDWGKKPEIKKLCQFTRELGLEGIDFVTTYGVAPKEVRKITDDYGLKTVCYTFFADINFPDEKDRQPGLDKIKEGIEAALILGADKIMLPIKGKDGLSREGSRRNVVTGLKEAVEVGKAAGVIVTVEHFPDFRSPFIVSTDVNKALKEIPDLKITFDSGNVLTGGEEPVRAFLNSKDSIVHTHFKDWTLSTDKKGLKGLDGRYYSPALIGEGIVDHKSVLRAMKRAGYGGYINLEYEGNKYSPTEAMVKGLKTLQDIMSEI
ncbi:MAG: sugar phosphate isomerase/epimerase [Candidatus Omnitrophica bacterium]|nr:sugar phosphate isomerase/epimerase [Candidatus Omnitrophota bacterium]